MSAAKPLTIHVYNNAEKHRQTMNNVMTKHGVKTGPLIETIIDSFSEEDWEKYAQLAKQSRTKQPSPQVELAKAIKEMSDEDVAKLLAGMQQMGIQVDSSDS